MITYVLVQRTDDGTLIDILATDVRRAYRARRLADRLACDMPIGHRVCVERTDEFDGTLRAKLEARRQRRTKEAEQLRRAELAAAQRTVDACQRLAAARLRNEIAEGEFLAQMIAQRLRAAARVTRQIELRAGLSAVVSGPTGVL